MKVELTKREGYEHVVLTNNKGMVVELSTVGASIYDILLPNKAGELVSVVLKPTYMENYLHSYQQVLNKHKNLSKDQLQRRLLQMQQSSQPFFCSFFASSYSLFSDKSP